MNLPPDAIDPGESGGLAPRREVRLSAALPQRAPEPAPWQQVWRLAAILAAVGLLFGFLAVWRPSNPTKQFAEVVPLPVHLDPAKVPAGEFEAAWIHGLEAYEARKYAKSERFFRQALAIDAARAEVYLYLGSSLLQRHQVAPAVETLSMSVSLASAPEYWEESRWQLAQAFLLQGNPYAAMPMLREVARDGRRHRGAAADLAAKIEPKKKARD